MKEPLRARSLLTLHRDETGGEKDNVNTLLILALVVLPIVFVIIKMGRAATNKAKNAYDDVLGD